MSPKTAEEIDSQISEEEANTEPGDASIPYIDSGDAEGFGAGWGEQEDADPASEAQVAEPKESGEDADPGEGKKPAEVDATPPKESEKVVEPPVDPGPSAATGQSDPPNKSSESPKDVDELRDQLRALQMSQAKQESDLKAEINRLKQGIARPLPAVPAKIPDDSVTDIDEVLKPIEGIEPEVAKAIKVTFGALRKEISGLKAVTRETAPRGPLNCRDILPTSVLTMPLPQSIPSGKQRRHQQNSRRGLGNKRATRGRLPKNQAIRMTP